MEMILEKYLTLKLIEGMRVVKGKFGNYFELGLKDDDTENSLKF